MKKRLAVEDRKRVKEREKSRIFVIALIGVGVLLVGLFLFLTAFFRRSWSEGSDRNILLVPQEVNGYSGKILFAHISPSNHKINIVMLNPELSVNVIGGYQEYPLRSIYPLWKLEKRDLTYLPAVYSFALSKVIDGLWVSDKDNFDSNHPDFKNITQKLLFFKIASDLTLGDRIWLYKFTQSLRPDQLKVSTADTLADWQKIQTDMTYGDQANNCTFAVVNSIGISGAGTRVGNILDDSGFSIVRITDEESTLDKTELVVGDNGGKCQDQQDHALHALPLPIKIVHDASKTNQYRADMVLIIGSDMKSYF